MITEILFFKFLIIKKIRNKILKTGLKVKKGVFYILLLQSNHLL